MMYIERQIVGMLADALMAHAMANGQRITIDGDRGYDPEAMSVMPLPDNLATARQSIIDECDQYDEVHLFLDGPNDGSFDDEGNPVEGHGPWVYLIFGNGNCGWDVIADHSSSLEETLKDVTDFAMEEGANG